LNPIFTNKTTILTRQIGNSSITAYSFEKVRWLLDKFVALYVDDSIE
jgi:hypothetical protein